VKCARKERSRGAVVRLTAGSLYAVYSAVLAVLESLRKVQAVEIDIIAFSQANVAMTRPDLECARSSGPSVQIKLSVISGYKVQYWVASKRRRRVGGIEEVGIEAYRA
jgi:hypothetical protein